MITVYTRPGCIQCRYTIKFLVEHQFAHTVIDLDDNEEVADKLTHMGITTLPYVETPQGDWAGFKLEKLRDLR